MTVVGTPVAAAGTRDLAAARIKLVTSSGRYDLVVDGDISGNIDNGANYYLQEGQDFLDELVEIPSSIRRWKGVLATGQIQVEIQRLMSVNRLWIITTADGRTDLTDSYLTPDAMRKEYTTLTSGWESGTPTYWTMNRTGLAPEQIGLTSADFVTDGVLDYEDVRFGPDWGYSGILFAPRADVDYNLEVIGRFYSVKLEEDSDVSFWTQHKMSILINAARYKMESEFGNMARAVALLATLERDLSALDNVTVDRELIGLDLEH